MKKCEISYYDDIIKVLKKLKKDYPNYEMGRHLDLAFSDYRDLFNTSDKEILHALVKYAAELDMNTVPDEDIQTIIKDTEEMFKDVESEDENIDEDF